MQRITDIDNSSLSTSERMMVKLLDSLNIQMDLGDLVKPEFRKSVINQIVTEIESVDDSEINNFRVNYVEPSEISFLLIHYLHVTHGAIGLINFCLNLSSMTTKFKGTATFKDSKGDKILIRDVFDTLGASYSGEQTSRKMLTLATIKNSLAGITAGLRFRYAKRSRSPWVVDYTIFSRMVNEDTLDNYNNMLSNLWICFPAGGCVTGINDEAKRAWRTWSYCMTEWSINLFNEGKLKLRSVPKHKEGKIQMTASVEYYDLEATDEAKLIHNMNGRDLKKTL